MPNPYFTWSMAEELAVGHMRALGFKDAKRTKGGADGGVDVRSEEAIAQVKHYAKPISNEPILRIKGAAWRGEQAIFYSSSGYTAPAIAYADEASVALFIFTESNDIAPANVIGSALAGRNSVREDLLERLRVLEFNLLTYSTAVWRAEYEPPDGVARGEFDERFQERRKQAHRVFLESYTFVTSQQQVDDSDPAEVAARLDVLEAALRESSVAIGLDFAKPLPSYHSTFNEEFGYYETFATDAAGDVWKVGAFTLRGEKVEDDTSR